MVLLTFDTHPDWIQYISPAESYCPRKYKWVEEEIGKIYQTMLYIKNLPKWRVCA